MSQDTDDAESDSRIGKKTEALIGGLVFGIVGSVVLGDAFPIAIAGLVFLALVYGFFKFWWDFFTGVQNWAQSQGGD